MGNMVKQRNLAEEREIPLSASAGGKNCYRVNCSVSSQSYGVCQHIVRAFVRGDLRGFEDCRDLIETRKCPAMKMMKMERDAGRCLFYDEYIPVVAQTESTEEVREEKPVIKDREGFMRGWNRVDEVRAKLAGKKPEKQAAKRSKKAPSPKSTNKKASEGTGNFLADAINKEIQESMRKQAQ